MGVGTCYANQVACNNSWGNIEWDYHPDCDSLGVSGNISENPLFCRPDLDDYSIASESPCAPENSGGCGLIGAFDVGCTATSVQEAHHVQTDWGSIKKLFR